MDTRHGTGPCECSKVPMEREEALSPGATMMAGSPNGDSSIRTAKWGGQLAPFSEPNKHSADDPSEQAFGSFIVFLKLCLPSSVQTALKDTTHHPQQWPIIFLKLVYY